jgi:hypothetical protein
MSMMTSIALLRGGLDLVTPAVSVQQGMAIGGVNYEPEVRGYRRISGYERYDGRPRPSSASYWVINFDAGSATIAEGNTVTGATSGATGKALIAAVVETGSYGGSDAAGYLVLTDVSGTFQDNENLQVSAVTKCVANGTATERGATTDANDMTWIRDAIETRRSAIAVVPGEGPVRGVFVLGGSLYAIRNNVGSTAAVLHKQSTSGWAAQSLGSYLKFDAGTNDFIEGETVTGGTSGATATVRRVVLLSGAWSGSAVGYLTLSGVTGTFQNNENITGSGGGAAVVDGTLTANTLPAGGHYDVIVHNFYGSVYSERAYGCQGQGRAFEWDGTYFSPIFSGLSDSLDKPTHISHYANHLFLGFATGEVINSEIGEPLQYSTTGGALSFSFGSAVSDFSYEESSALLIFGKSQIGYIAGDDSSNFTLSYISHDAGSKEWTYRTAINPTYVDTAGIRSVQATDTYGNWKAGTLSRQVEPLFESKFRNNIEPATSMRVRAKDQYRLFFNDGTGLIMYLGRSTPEFMPFELDHTAFCTCEGIVNSESQESVFFGTTDGYVMEMERGTSFDGAEVFAWVRIHFNNLGSPTQNKRYHKAVLEVDAEAAASISIITDYAYGSPSVPVGSENVLTVAAGGGYWDQALWNDFFWSAQFVGEAEAYLDGFGQNISAVMVSEATYEEPHTLKSLTIHFSPRGLRR